MLFLISPLLVFACLIVLATFIFVYTLSRRFARTKLGLIGFGAFVFIFGVLVYHRSPGNDSKSARTRNLATNTVLTESASGCQPIDVATTKVDDCPTVHETPANNFEEIARFAQAIDLSLSSFFLSRGDGTYVDAVWKTTDCNPRQLLWLLSYYVFHFCCVFFVYSLGTRLFGPRVRNEVRLFWHSAEVLFGKWAKRVLHRLSENIDAGIGRERIFVFWGNSDREAEKLSKSLESTSIVPVFAVPVRNPALLDQEETAFTRDLTARNLIWVHANPLRPGKWLSQAGCHFFLSPDWQGNVNQASALLSCKKLSPLTDVYVRLGESSDEDTLYKWADAYSIDSIDEVDKIGRQLRPEVHVVREESLVSSEFLWKHPMSEAPGIEINPRTGRASGEFRLLLVGFGAQGKVLLNDMVSDAQLPGTTFSATIIDRCEESFASFSFECSEAVDAYHLDFQRMDIYSKVFWTRLAKILDEEKKPFNRVVISMQDDAENLRLANRIAKMYLERRIPLRICDVFFARIRSDMTEEILAKLRIARGATEGMPSTFGAQSTIYTLDNIVQESQDDGAKFRNWLYYHEDGESMGARWLRTSTFNKESSRASVFGIRTLLRLIGLQADRDNSDAAPFDASSKEGLAIASAIGNHDVLDALAEAEHNRWMAFLLMRGVKTWKPTDEELNSLAKKGMVKANRLKEENRHAALVPFAELKDVAARIDHANTIVWKAKVDSFPDAPSPSPSKIATDDENTVKEILEVIEKTGWHISPVQEKRES